MEASPDRALVSVIIPTFNRASILPATLESVLAQTYPAIEIIVVDDGSTDATAAVVAGYGARVRYIHQANQGVEMARNRGIRCARGAYLTFLDDDDLLLAPKIERQVAVLQARPEVGLVHCGYHYIDRDGKHLETTGRLPEGDVRRQLAWGCFPWSGGPLIRRTCLELIGEDEHRDWFGDWGMWLRVALAGFPFACIQEPLGCYRIVPGSMTDDKVANCERLVFHILDALFTRWELPAEISAERDQIYAGWHFWLACRYYSGGFWDDARRSLSATLRLRPELLCAPEELLQLFFWDATSPRGRVNDPIRFINQLFDQLPAEAAPIAPYRAQLLGQIYTGLAVRSYAAGQLELARAQIIAALQIDPGLAGRPERVVDAVLAYAQGLSHEAALGYLDTVFHNLPREAAGLRQVRSQALGEMFIAHAFADYTGGRRRAVPGQVLTAARHHPAVLKNRGVLAIFARSLPAMLTKVS